jgi:pyruvate/2-oxoglutarate dehydrogenase complex dihydrolipoamide dehydrogenase (E3) component
MAVIGAVAACLVTSDVPATVKASVTPVETGAMGGDGLDTGCVPSQALLRMATLVQRMRRSVDVGVAAAHHRLDVAQVMARRVHVVHGVHEIAPHVSVERLRALGVEVQIGRARIVGPWHVDITRADGGAQRLATRSIVIAIGARPFVPPLPGLAENCLTGQTLWCLRELPRRLEVLGGRSIGCELAQAFALPGSQVAQARQARQARQVTQVKMAPRLLAREYGEDSAFAQAALQADVQLPRGRQAGPLRSGRPRFVRATKRGLGLNKTLGSRRAHPALAEADNYAAGEWKRARRRHC